MSSIYEKFGELPTTCISDALKGLTNMDVSIKPLKEEYKVSGPACTVKVLANDNLIVLQGIRTAQPGDVLVVDSKGYEYNAIAGDFVMGMAQTLGLAGIVADGTVRDIVGVKELDFPVFCKGNTISAGGKAGVGELNVPISCGGVAVKPGDIIIGDADGVIVVPRDQAEKVLQDASEKDRKDQERAKSVLCNAETVRRHLDKVLSK